MTELYCLLPHFHWHGAGSQEPAKNGPRLPLHADPIRTSVGGSSSGNGSRRAQTCTLCTRPRRPRLTRFLRLLHYRIYHTASFIGLCTRDLAAVLFTLHFNGQNSNSVKPRGKQSKKDSLLIMTSEPRLLSRPRTLTCSPVALLTAAGELRLRQRSHGPIRFKCLQ